MALTRNTTAGRFALEVGGKLSGSVRSLQPPGWQVSVPARSLGPGNATRTGLLVDFDPMSATFDVLAGDPLLDWALGLARQRPVLADGMASVMDANGRVGRRISWTAGLPVRLELPALDAGAKSAFQLSVDWQPEDVGYPAPAGDKGPLFPAVKAAKRLQCSNFRVGGLPFDPAGVVGLALPTVTARVAVEQLGTRRRPERRITAIDLGQIALRLAGRQRDEALAWVQKLLVDGQVDTSELLDLTAELLDPSLKTVLARVQLGGCLLLGCEEARLDAQDTVPALTLRFAVGALDLSVSA